MSFFDAFIQNLLSQKFKHQCALLSDKVGYAVIRKNFNIFNIWLYVQYDYFLCSKQSITLDITTTAFNRLLGLLIIYNSE